MAAARNDASAAATASARENTRVTVPEFLRYDSGPGEREMGTRDPRIDAYIAKSGDFAKPILIYIRDIVHEACPGVEETLKWNSPSFEYQGLLCGMAAFKQHAIFGFWKHPLV